MPQWAGSCWYYLRYVQPRNAERLVDPAAERYWLPVDLYVGARAALRAAPRHAGSNSRCRGCQSLVCDVSYERVGAAQSRMTQRVCRH